MTKVRFTPLCNSDSERWCCYLLSIGEDNILLDCGWTPEFRLEDIAGLCKVIESKTKISAVLLSQPDIAHIGALPYAYGQLGLDAPIYCPLPLRNEGMYLLSNELISRTQREPFTLFGEKDIRATMTHFLSADYGNELAIETKNGLRITVHKAGGKIGGGVWTITNEMESIVYAVSYNSLNEVLLDPFSAELLARPWMLITDISNVGVSVPKRTERDTQLQNAVATTLLREGNVLLPVDSASRWLELALVLLSGKRPPPLLYLLSYASEQAASPKYIEYLRQSGHLAKDLYALEAARSNGGGGGGGGDPLKLLESGRVVRVKSLSDVRGKACVLASGPDLASGFAKDLFLRWCSGPMNTVIFTDRGSERSLARTIISTLSEKPMLTIPVWNVHEGMDEDDDDDDDEDEDENEGTDGNGTGQAQEGEGMVLDETNSGSLRKSGSDIRHSHGHHGHHHHHHGGRHKDHELGRNDNPENPLLTEFDATPESFKMAGLQHAMFPSDEEFAAVAWREDRKAKGLNTTPVPMVIDDYGMVIDPEEYTVKEEAFCNYSTVESPLFKELNAIFQSNKSGLTFDRETLEVRPACNLCFIDYEGRSGDEHVRDTIKRINPVNLILVNGRERAVQTVTADAKAEEIKNIYAPRPGESVEVVSNMYVHRVTIEEPACPSTYPAFVDATVDGFSSSGSDGSSNGGGSFKILEDNNRPWHDTVMLTSGPKGRKEIFNLLIREGFPAYYDDSDNHAIVCNCASGSFVVRVPEDNIADISFEGPLCDEYFMLKKIIYSNYNMV